MPLITSLSAFLLTLYCLLDVALSPAGSVRNMPRAFWVLVVLFVPLIGAVAWLFAGRPVGSGLSPGGPGSAGESGARSPGPADESPRGSAAGVPRTPPLGPEDDPEFVRRLEDELRRRGGGNGDAGGR